MTLNYTQLSKQIPSAYNRVSPHVHKTPVLSSEQLNTLSGMKVFLKCENFQKVGAFKYRGASNAVLEMKESSSVTNLSDEEKSSSTSTTSSTSTASTVRAVCTHSSGNHAQALAKAARDFGFEAHIVMPKNAPSVKVNAVRDTYGATVHFCEPNQQAREEMCDNIQKTVPNCEFVHPYNDLRIILGQGTCMYEFYHQLKEMQSKDTELKQSGDGLVSETTIDGGDDLAVDAILCPIGGGGLMSGTCLAGRLLTEQRMKIYGVEPEKANDAQRSLEAGIHLKNESPPQTIGDGLLTNLGSLTYPIILEHVEKVYTASDEEAVAAIKFVWERMKIIIEPSSAFAVAVAMFNKEFQETNKDKRVGIIISGGNVDIKEFTSKYF